MVLCFGVANVYAIDVDFSILGLVVKASASGEEDPGPSYQ